jgi:hypothetical protein
MYDGQVQKRNWTQLSETVPCLAITAISILLHGTLRTSYQIYHREQELQKKTRDLLITKKHTEHYQEWLVKPRSFTQCGARTHDHKIKSLALCRLS